jgi:hypothetical protein
MELVGVTTGVFNSLYTTFGGAAQHIARLHSGTAHGRISGSRDGARTSCFGYLR